MGLNGKKTWEVIMGMCYENIYGNTVYDIYMSIYILNIIVLLSDIPGTSIGLRAPCTQMIYTVIPEMYFLR